MLSRSVSSTATKLAPGSLPRMHIRPGLSVRARTAQTCARRRPTRWIQQRILPLRQFHQSGDLGKTFRRVWILNSLRNGCGDRASNALVAFDYRLCPLWGRNNKRILMSAEHTILFIFEGNLRKFKCLTDFSYIEYNMSILINTT